MRRLLFPLVLCLLAISCVPSDEGLMYDPKDIACYDTTLWNTCCAEIKARNVMTIRTVGSHTLMVNDKEYPIGCLKDRVKMFLTNPNHDEALPEMIEVEWKDGRDYCICKGVVSICTNCSLRKGRFYHKVLSQVNLAIAELRNQYARYYYQKPYSSLQGNKKEFVEFLVPDGYMEMDNKYYLCDNTIPPPPLDLVGE